MLLSESVEETLVFSSQIIDCDEILPLAPPRQQISQPKATPRPQIQPILLPNAEPVGPETLVGPIIDYALTLKGRPYKFGGTTPKAFDCSGYLQYVFKKHNIELPHASYAIAALGRPVERASLRKGDLLFFTGTSRHTDGISHVGLVTEVSDGSIHFAHATRRGVMVDDLENMDYYRHHFAMARRVLE